MTGFLVRRSLQLVFVVWCTVTLLFFLFFLLPGNPAELIANGGTKHVNAQVLANIRAKYGLDEPIPVQYVQYLGRTVRLDFGNSYRTGDSVSSLIAEKAPASLRLAFWALLLEATVGIGLGLMAARRRNSWADNATTVLAAVASAIPVFVFAHVLQQLTGVYAYEHGWPSWLRLPVEGIGPNQWFLGVIPGGTQWRYVIQPAIVLASISVVVVARLTRGALLETTKMDYIRTARAKGLTERRIGRRHALRNAMIPVITSIGLDFAALVGSAVLTEYVFNWPGLGSELAAAAEGRDLPVLLGGTIVVVVVVGVVNLLVDLSYAWLDPRVRIEATG